MMEQHGWLANKLALGLAAFANSTAWIHSAISDNINVGAVVTAGTVVVPALCAGVIYAIKNVGPVWLQFRKDLDAAKSQTLGGQMERLNQNLEITILEKDANKQLAIIAKEQADRLQEMYSASEAKNGETLALLAAIKLDMRKANEKLHAMTNEASGYKGQAYILQVELDEYKARLGPVIEQAHANAQKIDALDAKVDMAGTVLARSNDPDAPLLTEINP